MNHSILCIICFLYYLYLLLQIRIIHPQTDSENRVSTISAPTLFFILTSSPLPLLPSSLLPSDFG